jgi:5-methylcytosine-specific restriction endonuclease McrA
MIKRSKPPRSRPSTLKANRELRRAVLERDGHACLMMVRSSHKDEHGQYFNAAPCFNPAVDAAHVFPRAQCGRAKYSPDVCVASCRRCHDLWHAHNPNVAFPGSAVLRAEKAIAAAGNKTTLKPSIFKHHRRIK